MARFLDLATLSRSYAESNLISKHISTWCDMWRMEVSNRKCAVLATHSDKYCHVYYNGKPIPEVEHFKYLGIYFSHDLSFTHHFRYVKTKALRLLKRFHRFFKNRLIPPKYQTLIIKERFLNALTYGIETWGQVPSHISGLQTLLNGAIRAAFGLAPKATTQAHQYEMLIPCIQTILQQFKISLVRRNEIRLSLLTSFQPHLSSPYSSSIELYEHYNPPPFLIQLLKPESKPLKDAIPMTGP